MYHYIIPFHFFPSSLLSKHFSSPIHQFQSNQLRSVSLFAIFLFFLNLISSLFFFVSLPRVFFVFFHFLRSFTFSVLSPIDPQRLLSSLYNEILTYRETNSTRYECKHSVNAFSSQEVRINAFPSSWWRRYPRHCVLQPSPSYWVHRVPRDLWYKWGQADFMAWNKPKMNEWMSERKKRRNYVGEVLSLKTGGRKIGKFLKYIFARGERNSRWTFKIFIWRKRRRIRVDKLAEFANKTCCYWLSSNPFFLSSRARKQCMSIILKFCFHPSQWFGVSLFDAKVEG